MEAIPMDSPTGGTGGETGRGGGGEPGSAGRAGGEGSDKSLLQRLTQSRGSWNKTEGKRSRDSRLRNVAGSAQKPVGGVAAKRQRGKEVGEELQAARQERRDDRMRGLQSMFVSLFVFLILLAILYVLDQLLLKGKLGTKIRYGLLTGGGVLAVLISLWAGFTFIKRGEADYDSFDKFAPKGGILGVSAATSIAVAVVVAVAVAVSRRGVRL